MIEVSFYHDGKFIGQAVSTVYPNYREGDTLELNTSPSARDLIRRPAQDVRSEFFKILKVHHIIEEHREMTFFFKLDVILGKHDDEGELEYDAMGRRRDRRKTAED